VDALQGIVAAIALLANLVAIVSVLAARQSDRPRRFALRSALAAVVVVFTGIGAWFFAMSNAYRATASADASEKATLLARGISEAMNLAAFGALSAVLPVAATVWILLRPAGSR